eukprot:2342015-Amphidinium_carterae.1
MPTTLQLVRIALASAVSYMLRRDDLSQAMTPATDNIEYRWHTTLEYHLGVLYRLHGNMCIAQDMSCDPPPRVCITPGCSR